MSENIDLQFTLYYEGERRFVYLRGSKKLLPSRGLRGHLCFTERQLSEAGKTRFVTLVHFRVRPRRGPSENIKDVRSNAASGNVSTFEAARKQRVIIMPEGMDKDGN